MAYDRFLIAPIKSGLIKEIPAWQIPEDAYERFKNVYIHHGVIRKRFGAQYMGSGALTSRLRIKLGTTDGSGNFGDGASTVVPGARFLAGQSFSIGTEVFTVQTTGTPVAMLSSTGVSSTRTFNTTTGAYQFAGAAPSTDVYYYPADPVMELTHFENSNVESNPTYAMDRQFIYTYTCGTGWDREGTVVLHGSDSQFIWSLNWQGVTPDTTAMFITNYNATVGAPGASDDPMYARSAGTWSVFRPIIAASGATVSSYVQTAKIIIPFKNRILLLNTIEYESGTNKLYVNRCRYSHYGSPFPAAYHADLATYVEADVSSAWLPQNTSWTIGATTEEYTGAGYTDAPTKEEIMSAEFIKDRLIVYFEDSTWEIAFTGNQVEPFVWQKLNTELGTKALKCPVPFDKAVLTVGRTGIHGCSGANVTKINDKIEEITYDIRISDDGVERTAGVRDYKIDVVYWSYADKNAGTYAQIFPSKLLIYNYQEDSWGIADDCITAFGYYDQQCTTPQTMYKQVIGGNQQGYTFLCDSDSTSNDALMYITNISGTGTTTATLTIINHTLNDDDYIRIEDATDTNIDETINYKVTTVSNDTVTITLADALTGTYAGGGLVARIPQIDILSKQWNFYVDKGKNCYLAKISFAVKRTASGQVTVDYYPSSTTQSMISAGTTTGSILGSNNLDTAPYSFYGLEQYQDRLWHPVYFQGEGECVQIRIYLDDEQLADQDIADSDFRLEGLIVFTRPTSERMQ